MSFQTLSPREFAQVIGVSESSIKRWVDSGIIQVTKTAGGHRRITVGEAIRFIRRRRMQIIQPELLGISDIERVKEDIPGGALTAETLYDLLVRGDSDRASAALLSSYVDGARLAELHDGPIREALSQFGELWCSSQKGIFTEHRATSAFIEALSQVRLFIAAPAQGASVAIGGSPEHDPYIIPNLMVLTVLSDLGYKTTNLGPHTPAVTFLDAIEEHKPDLVWVAMTSSFDGGDLTSYVRLFEQLGERSIDVVIGGREAERHKEEWPELVHLLPTMSSLEVFAQDRL